MLAEPPSRARQAARLTLTAQEERRKERRQRAVQTSAALMEGRGASALSHMTSSNLVSEQSFDMDPQGGPFTDRSMELSILLLSQLDRRRVITYVLAQPESRESHILLYSDAFAPFLWSLFKNETCSTDPESHCGLSLCLFTSINCSHLSLCVHTFFLAANHHSSCKQPVSL